MSMNPILHAQAIEARKNKADLLDNILERLNELEMRVSNLELSTGGPNICLKCRSRLSEGGDSSGATYHYCAKCENKDTKTTKYCPCGKP